MKEICICHRGSSIFWEASGSLLWKNEKTTFSPPAAECENLTTGDHQSLCDFMGRCIFTSGPSFLREIGDSIDSPSLEGLPTKAIETRHWVSKWIFSIVKGICMQRTRLEFEEEQKEEEQQRSEEKEQQRHKEKKQITTRREKTKKKKKRRNEKRRNEKRKNKKTTRERTRTFFLYNKKLPSTWRGASWLPKKLTSSRNTQISKLKLS